jgi:hypothetical protein
MRVLLDECLPLRRYRFAAVTTAMTGRSSGQHPKATRPSAMAEDHVGKLQRELCAQGTFPSGVGLLQQGQIGFCLADRSDGVGVAGKAIVDVVAQQAEDRHTRGRMGWFCNRRSCASRDLE